MSVKKTLASIASYALVGAVALGIGGTLAHEADIAADANVFMSGDIDIIQNEYQRDENGDFVKFEQFKSFLPAMGKTTWAEFDDPNLKFFNENFLNAQDKIVTVKNVGSNPAYVRTVMAFECGDLSWADFDKYIGVNATDWNDEKNKTCQWNFEWVVKEPVDIEGVKYMIAVADYVGTNGTGDATYLNPGEETKPSLREVYLAGSATNEIAAKFGNTYDILVATQAVQVGEATAEQAWQYAFNGAISSTNHPWLDEQIKPDTITGTDETVVNEAFKDAATAEKGQIVINLESDVTYDVTAWAVNGMGGSVTDEIIINGNGHTITFNQLNSDWNNIVTNNDATLYINNATITSSGHNDGPWNRHDINFGCDVVLNNVTSDKALAFKADADLTNVTVSDANTSDTYAIWIQPNGQNVTLNNCTIDMLACSDGRGIKIDNQYVDAANEVKVTLTVSDTVFKTEEKSAIIVKSTVGADVVLDNVDISGVAADSTNPVWVDQDSAAYADLVTVTGGSKIIEP